ncbi:MAG TPA: hypothetical protein PLX29_02990, partial [Anaerolineaceae bacterium]|nr:hypothetical protein [Anaerolineaceae bacterium]
QEHPALAQGARKSLRWLNHFRQKKLRSRVYWQEHPALAQGARKSLRWLNQFRQRTSGQGFTGRNIQHSHRALANPFGGSTNSGKEAQVKGLLDAVDMTQYTLQGCCF